MHKLIYILLFILSYSISNATTGDPKEKKKKDSGGDPKETVSQSPRVGEYVAPAVRQFDNLNNQSALSNETDPLVIEEFEGEITDKIAYYRKRAVLLDHFVREKERFTEFLDEKTVLDLPVGIKKTIGNLEYNIVIDSLVMTPQYAYLIAYMSFVVPSSGDTITFRGDNIKLSKKGGITAEAQLHLLGDYPINVFGNKTIMVLKGGDTYAEFDCNGFSMMGIGADITFSREMLLPENALDSVGSDRVQANFKTTLSNWNDLIATINLPPFQVNGLKNVVFNVNNAVFDFSDYRNAPAVEFPDDYLSTLMLAEVPELWRGFYLRELSVALPKQFIKRGEGDRIHFAAENMLIDNMGFTGNLSVNNVFNIKEGDMNGWQYSMDSLFIDIQANSIRSGGFKGDIVIPVSKETHPFHYSAIIQPNNEYIFNVTATDSIEFDMFRTSRVEIYPSSYLEIEIKDNRFLPRANLNGSMDISAELGKGKQGVELADISFENLQIQSVKPYIQVGVFSFGSENTQQSLANFPVSINNIGMKNISDTEIGLDFDLLLNLTGSDGGSFAADAGLTILAEMPGTETHKWVYKDVDVRDIAIDIDGGAFKFKGSLTFYKNDVMYGEGFNGQVDAEFKPGIKVKASAVFGNVDGYRYWYADALGSFPGGLPIFTGVGVYGFGGGAYYRMAMDTEGVGSELGKTASGIVYVPKQNAGLGLKATIELGSHPKPEAFNGDVTLEAAFFKGGGIRYISFKGNGYLATPPADGTLSKIKEKTQKLAAAVSKLEKSAGNSPAGVLLASNQENDQIVTQIYGQIGEAAGKKGQISAHVFISYDFDNQVLHGNFEAYMNVAEGIIKGVGEGDRAGWAVLHFAPDEWYVYVGTPDDRIGLSVGIGSLRAETTSYFMVGNKIPGSPPPPQEISDILGGEDFDYMRDFNALGTGAGFAFGSNFSVDTGDLTFAMFYARLAAGAGFDIMLKDYGNASCEGRSGPVGINGWYANGQAYAYFEGKIGIRVKVFGRRRNVDILKLGAAAILQAKLPNPFWMKGTVGGYFSVLGGLVKGQCKFEVTLGEECELVGVGSAVEGIRVISELTPNDGEKDVNVFNTPQAVFNMPVDEVFELIDLDGKKKSFRIKLDAFKVLSGGYEIPGEIEWNDAHDVIAYNSFDVFPSEKEMKVVAQVSFEESTSGKWSPVYVEGKQYIERSEITFTSGIAPPYISLDNVEYSYPVIGQVNYYKQENSNGYIKLKKGQPYLFNIGNEWTQKGRLSLSSAESNLFDFNYNISSKEVTFTIPTAILNDKIYSLELINLPTSSGGSVDRNVSANANKVLSDTQEIDTEIITKEAQGTIEELQEKSIFSTHIRVSHYNTLKDKLNAADMSRQWRWPIRNGVHELGKAVVLEELFDNAELNGLNSQKPLIQFEAILNNNKYYNDYMYPIIYDNYPLEEIFEINWRDIQDMGVPPKKAVFIRQHPETNLQLSETNILTQNYSFLGLTSALIYNLSHYYQNDLSNLQNQVANYYSDSGYLSKRLEFLLSSTFPRMLGGPYQVKVKYVLPGKEIVVSEQIITINNPID